MNNPISVKRALLLVATLFTMLGAAPVQAATAEIVIKGLQFAEGTIFVGQTLYFVDYGRSDVYRLDGQQAQRVWHQDNCGANGLVQVPQGLVVACYDNGTVQRIRLDGQSLQTIDRDSAGNSFDRPNDLAADKKGNVYFTASGSDGAGLGKVYLLPPTGAAREVANGIHNANGVAMTLDGHGLYVGESSTDRVLLFDISQDGSLANRRVFIDLDTALADGRGGRHTPDGIRVDREGRLFVSLYNGGGFAVFGTEGKQIARVELPGQHHANLALTPNEDYVYGTIANDTLMDGYAGALYRIRNPVAQ
jgi:gluconolactonase